MGHIFFLCFFSILTQNEVSVSKSEEKCLYAYALPLSKHFVTQYGPIMN